MARLRIRPFVVTGCGRSGTYYTAELLQRVGIRCGHETVFEPATTAFTGFGTAHGDVSWLAAPFLPQLDTSTLVLHQVRDPVAVVRSLVGIGFFDDPSHLRSLAGVAAAHAKWRVRRALESLGQVPVSARGPRPYHYFKQFVRVHAPSIFDEPTATERALRYWVLWNSMVEQGAAAAGLTYRRYRLEDLDAALLQELVGAIGVPISIEHAELLTESLPRELNARRRADIAWNTLPASATKDEAHALAERYGYVPGAEQLPVRSSTVASG